MKSQVPKSVIFILAAVIGLVVVFMLLRSSGVSFNRAPQTPEEAGAGLPAVPGGGVQQPKTPTDTNGGAPTGSASAGSRPNGGN